VKRLTKDQTKKLEQLVEELSEQADAIQTETETYNEILNRARALIEEVASSIEEYVEKRSDAWKESEAADAYTDWLQSWQEIDLEEIEEIDLTHSEELEALPKSLNS